MRKTVYDRVLLISHVSPCPIISISLVCKICKLSIVNELGGLIFLTRSLAHMLH